MESYDLKIKHIAWTDLETTGGDQHVDPIIEIGIVLTGLDLVPIARFSMPVPTAEGALYWMARCDPVVAEMHDRNGLWKDSDSAVVRDIAEADALAAEWLHTQTGSKKHVALAGSGVGHFDRRFIVAQLPKLDRALTYWPLDVGQIRRFMALANRADLIPEDGDGERKNHRAVDDAEKHLDEARYYLELFGDIFPIPR